MLDISLNIVVGGEAEAQKAKTDQSQFFVAVMLFIN